jgi:hypothetical protein
MAGDQKLSQLPAGNPIAATDLFYSDQGGSSVSQTATAMRLYIGNSSTTFNVRAFGATGNGTTDDTAAINSAIAAFNAAGAGVLYFPAGTYLTTASLTSITASGTIKGDGSSDLQTFGIGPVSQINCNSLSAVVFTLQAQQQVVIRDLAIVDTAVGTPLVGSSAIIAGSAAVSNPKVDMMNVTVNGFYTGVDRQSGQLWLMDNCFIFGPVLYGVRVRNLNNADVGDWCISNCFFYPLAPAGHNATSAIRIESSGGGKIINSKVNGTASFFATGIDIQGTGATLDMQISNCSFEAFSSVGISVNGSWANVTIANCEIGALAAGGAVNAISMVNTNGFTIVGITTAGTFSGPVINLSNVSNYYIAGITGVNWIGSIVGGGNSNKVMEFRDSGGDIITNLFDINNGYTIQNSAQWVVQFATQTLIANFQTPNSSAAVVAAIEQVGGTAVRFGLKASGTALLFDDSSSSLTTPSFGIRGSSAFPTNYGAALPAAGQLLWSSGTDPSATVDTGAGRVAAGLSEHNNGAANGVGYVRLNGVAVASLPTPSATYQGARGTVNNSNATLTAGIGAIVAGGGTNVVPVFCDGTNWRIG